MRRVALMAVVLATCCACGAGPSLRPAVAVEGRTDGSPAQSEVPSPDAPPVDPGVPTDDIPWRDCTGTSLADQALAASSAGVILECAEFSAPIDVTGAIDGNFTAGLTRARTSSTPANAYPIVFTSGTDRSSGNSLAMLATSGLTTVLADHPVVALDRRGIDRSTAIDCMTPEIRRGLHDLGQFDADSTGDAADAVAALGHDATIACTDYLDPQELKFGADSAAEDIDALRTRWGLETIALWSAGSGSDIALSYAAAHPDNLARLILDSPAPVATDAATEAESRVQGEEAALTAFAQRCVALGCSLGPDPKKAVTDLMERARADEFQPLSAAAVSNAISASLWTAGTNREQETRSLSDALSALGTGNASPIRERAARAENEVDGDGQFIGRCTDGMQWPGIGRVRELADTWGTNYPVFGREAALGLLACASWPSTANSPLPNQLKPAVLVLSGQGDPAVGNSGLSTVTGVVTNAGSRFATLDWQGAGHPAAQSTCAQQAMRAYLTDASLPSNGSVCPA
ncbi:alpha/beta hydrolase [Rhodococcus erythropolis]|uniref:alpha/beta hydrolase n=1 Tax=Rhodococcus erythropolis TaxID=1833 RepID=UPI002948F614|nr:alpha/beta hydrolase [Rhodococcus erythropolis]MDV6208280.1 alpha/beta hydrolase [Rhodococcus erythropolis]